MSMFGDRHKKNTEDAEGDPMLPFMSLLLIIIPILITNLSFYHLRSVSINTPGSGGEPEDEVVSAKDLPPDTKVMLNLNIETTGVNLDLINEASGAVVDSYEGKLDSKTATVLRKRVLGHRHKFEHLDTLLVSVGEKVFYKDLVLILDECKRDDEKLREQNALIAEGKGENQKMQKKFSLVLLPKEVDGEV